MKKNKTLRLAAALLILVLLTTGIISGTFAKYVTEGSAKDTARVAKWGVTVTTSGSLYSNAYAAKAGDNSGLPTAWTEASPAANDITVTTKDITDDNIVAPGTESAGTGLSFGITGTPEVAVKVVINVSAEDIFLAEGKYGVMVKETVNNAEDFGVLKTANPDKVYTYDTTAGFVAATAYAPGQEYYVLTSEATVDANGYYPVKYTLEGETDVKKATDVADKLAEKIKAGVTDTPETVVYTVEYKNIENIYPANIDLGGAGGVSLSGQKISWEWAYDKKNADNSVDPNIDACDTVLGDLIAARGATGDSAPKYVVVSIDATTGAVTVLTISNGTDDYTVKKGDAIVANLRTMVNISLSVTQVD